MLLGKVFISRSITDEKVELIHEGVKSMCHSQKTICEEADIVRDMGQPAEEDGLCPKGKFKGLAESYFRMQAKPDKAEDVVDRLSGSIATNLLENHGIGVIIGNREEEDDD